MNEENLYARNEVEINLGDLFWSVLRRWRAMTVFMLIFGVVFGGFGFIKEYKAYKDPETRQMLQDDYAKAVEKYDKDKEKIQRAIENSEAYQERLEDIKERCIYLRFDPYNIYEIEATYFIDSNYEINPSLSFQNINNIATLIRGYRTAIQRIDFESVIDIGGEDLTLRHPVSKYSNKNIYTLSVEEVAGLMQLTVTADTKDRAEKIFSEINMVIEDTKKMLKAAVGEHEISIINETALYVIDWDYEYLQKSFIEDYYEKNKDTIEDLKKQLEDLKEPKETVLSKMTVIKASIKKGIIGIAVGLIIASGIYIALYIFNDKVYNPDDIRRRYRLPMFGVMKLSGRDKKALIVDRKINARLGVPEVVSPEQDARLIASNVRLYLRDARKLLIIGSAGTTATEQLRERLQPLLADTEIVSAGDVNSDSETVGALSSDAAVICVEEWQKARHLDIVHELDRISATGNKRIGFVVVY